MWGVLHGEAEPMLCEIPRLSVGTTACPSVASSLVGEAASLSLGSF